MTQLFNIWQALAGLAIFMLGMQYLENSINHLSGRSFKLLLKKHASNKFKAISGGTLISAVLQSSSIVNLMVLAFVGAGVLTLKNALAVILGANLGTTLNSWLLATIGFSYNIENIAFPLAAIGGLIMVLSSKDKKIFTWSRLLLSLGFIFIGLYYIKSGTTEIVRQYDLSSLNQYPAILFLLSGILITSVIQSSSATMAITLSALYSGAISIYAGCAIILGSEIGTVSKLFFASINGTAVKRRVAMGSLIFNIIPAIPIFLLLPQINRLIEHYFPDHLLGLAAFQTLVNLFSIFIFLPFFKKLTFFLESLYKNARSITLFLSKSLMTDAEVAIEAFRSETLYLLYDTLDFTATCLEEEVSIINKDKTHPEYRDQTIIKKYEFIKQLNGQLRDYFIQIQNVTDKPEIASELDRLVTSARNGMYAAKSMKDILQDITQLRNSSNNIKYDFYVEGTGKTIAYCKQLLEILDSKNTPAVGTIMTLYESLTSDYDNTLQKLYKKSIVGHLNDSEISTLINYNRELATAHKSLFFAVKDFVMDPGQASELDNLPGFIR